jgi:CubicO group peptidase (beta-lactamase class C family)
MEQCIADGEVGLQVAVYRGEILAIDEWIGYADAETIKAVDARTLFPIFSVTKILPILAVHLQAERGLIDYDAPIAKYWPEYAANGKSEITVAHVLAHRAGVPNMPAGVTIDNIGDWDWMTGQLASLAPMFPTNSRSSYLSYTFGWLLGEVVRRTDPQGRSFQKFVSDELLAPLGITDLYLGTPDHESGRVAKLYAPEFRGASADVAPYRASAIPPGLAPGVVFNDPRLRRAAFPSAGAIATARSVARLMAMVANGGELDGVRLLSKSRVDRFSDLRPDPYVIDEVIGKVAIMSWSGFRCGSNHPNREPVIGTSPRVISHMGAGGSIAWADLEGRFSVAICHNRMFTANPDRPDAHPFARIGDAVREYIAT